MRQYRGIDVWEWEPNATSDPKDGMRRSTKKLDPGPGRLTVVDRSGVPTFDAETVPYLFMNRAEILAFRAFLAARKGQLNPCWVPSWKRDFRLYAAAAQGAAAIQIQPCGYSRFAFANLARRDLAIMPFDRSAKLFHRITSAQWNGGPYESLGLETPLESAIDDGLVTIAYLNFVRLASDDAGEMKWETTEVASAMLSFVSLPMEVPA